MSELRGLPKVDKLAQSPALASYPEAVRMKAAREAVRELREKLLQGDSLALQSAEEIAAEKAADFASASLRKAINLSGVILHTALGRARLAPAVAQHVYETASSHSLVEFDLETGRRGDRQAHVRTLLQELTGAEDALVVNNAAAAVVLTLTALAAGREVLLSRGQMVEIGGSFRMPDIIAASGCRLVEVGCTNKTHLRDYEQALTPESAAILRCHTSNYKIVGFTHQPSLRELRELAERRRILLLDDMGTGCLVDTSAFGLPKEPTLVESVANAHVAIASGDKLLGGPQAGLILGKAEPLAVIARHPLARAMRIDKLSLSALEATLRLYAQGRQQELPTIKYMSRSLEEVRALAEDLARVWNSQIDPGETEVGGGSAPGAGIPTWRVGLSASSPDELLKKLRHSDPPIIGRIENGVVWLDPRTLEEDELPVVRAALERL